MNDLDNNSNTARIRALNDQVRRNFGRGRLVITNGVHALGAAKVALLLQRVQTFNEFSEDNDPYGEHDFGAFEEGGQKFFWKIDYYDKNLEYGSDDPADPVKTCRVLTLMLASEY
jgi:hypothetical protein